MSEKLLYYGALYFIAIVCAGVSTAFYRKWAVSLVPTFIAGFLVSQLICTIELVPLSRFSVPYIVLCILSYSYICFFIYRCLTIQNNTVILKEKGIWLSLLAVSVIMGIFCLLFREKTMTACNSYCIKLSGISSLEKGNLPSYPLFFVLNICSTVLFSPVCEELVGRELVFKLIVRNRSKKIVFLLFIVFALIISLLHLNKKVLYLFMRWGLFTVLFFVRYRFPSNRQLWYCVCIHSLWNAVNAMYAILFNTFQ